MFTYKPIYQGDAIEEQGKFLERAASVYDQNLKEGDLIDTLLSQIKVPEGGKDYVNMVKGKVKENLAQIATDVNGGRRWDLATPQIHKIAKTVMNDQNLTFLQDEQKRYDEREKEKNALRLAGKAPIAFGESWDSYQPFDENGKQKRFKGFYEPKGDWDDKIAEMVSVIKPDEWASISQSEDQPGYFDKFKGSSNHKKIDDAINGIVQNFVIGATGDQMKRKFMQEGFSEKESLDYIKKYVKNVGSRYKVQSSEHDLDVDQMAIARMRAAAKGKAAPSDIGNIFGEDDGPITNEGKPKESTFDMSNDFDGENLRESKSVKQVTSTGGSGGIGDPGVLITSKKQVLSKQRQLIDDLKQKYPEAYQGKTDRQIAEDYAQSEQSLSSRTTTRARIKNPQVQDNVTQMANFESYLGKNEGFVVGTDPSDTKTLKQQLESGTKFKVNNKTKFKATGFNLEGSSKERGSHAGGIIGTATDEDGNSKEVVLPMDRDAQQHFRTSSDLVREIQKVDSFGKDSSDKQGYGKPVVDSSNLITNYYLKKAEGHANLGSLRGVTFGFVPQRVATANGGHLNQDVRLQLVYKRNGEWQKVVPGDQVYNTLEGVKDSNGNPVLDVNDWSLDKVRHETLDSFHKDSMIQNSFKVPAKKSDNNEEE